MSTVSAFPSNIFITTSTLARHFEISFDDPTVFAEMIRNDLKNVLVTALEALPNKVNITSPYADFIFPHVEFANLVNELNKTKKNLTDEDIEYLQNVVEGYLFKLIDLAVTSRDNVIESMRRRNLLTQEKVNELLNAPLLYMDIQRVTNILKEAVSLSHLKGLYGGKKQKRIHGITKTPRNRKTHK